MTESGGDHVIIYKNEGNAAYQKGDYETAIGLYSKAIETDQNNALLYNNRAAAYLMLNKYVDAFNDSKKSIQLDPTYPKALLRYLKCCINMGLIDEARNMCTTLRTLDPTMNTELSAQLHQIDMLQNTYSEYENKLAIKDYSYALHLIKKCGELSPGSLEFILKKIRLLIDMKRFNEAKHHVELALKVTGASVDLLYYRGLCLFYLDHQDKAISHFQHVLRIHPDHVQTQKTYKCAKKLLRLKDEGNGYIKDRRFSKARDIYTDALTVDPLHDAINSKLLCNRAYAQYNLENYNDSLDDCNRAITLDPAYVKAYVRRAKCYSALEMYEEAVNEWSEVMKRDPTSEHKRGLQEAKRELARSKEMNYYKVLGLKKNASFNQIKQAYKKLALEHHPDRHHDADETAKSEQEQKFKTIGEAYGVLSDPEKREQYDRGVYSASGVSQPDVRTMFSQTFPGGTFQFNFA